MGGGHLQISRELARRVDDRGGRARVLDVLSLMPRPFGGWLRRLYPWLVNRAPMLYQLVHDQFLVPESAGRRSALPVQLSLPGTRRVADEHQPDVAVATHPLAALVLGELRQRGELRCPVLTLVTTFSVNSMWIHPAVDLELCISEDAAADVTRRTGRPAYVVAPVVRPAFLTPPAPGTRQDKRRELGVPAEARTALVTTGAFGLAGSAADAARAVAARPGWAAVVLTGRNRDLQRTLDGVPSVIALDWEDDVPSLLAAADVLVDNAGGTSSKEALAFGLPVVTFRPISGHGRDDAAALQRLGLTDVVHDEERLVAVLDGLLGDPAAYAARAARGRSIFVADAAAVVEDAAAGLGVRPILV